MKWHRGLATPGMVTLLLVSNVVPAAAHPLLDEASELNQSAEFEAALEALNRAEAASDLESDDVARLFELRALVFFALGRTEEMTEELARLVTLDPEYVLAVEVPPRVRSVLEEVREVYGSDPLRLELSSQRPDEAGVEVRVRARALGDELGLVRRVVVLTRVEGSRRWERHRGTEVEQTVAEDTVLEYRAQAIGPGGAVIARARGESIPPERMQAPEEAGGVSPWWFVLGGSVIAVGAFLAVYFLVIEPANRRTQPGVPEFSMEMM
ncbi:MAG: hypothetical protein AAGF12_39845 [Myxococcota bacterium]